MKNGKIFRQRLANKECLLGAWLSIQDPAVAELMSNTGLDFLLIDMEHAPYSPTNLQNMLIGMNGTDCASLVRVPWNVHWIIKQVIDVGADAIIVPMVNNREEAEAAVAATRYPPAGIRGVGPRRAALYGINENYLDEANEGIGVVVQIETTEAVKNVEAIASTPGVDAVYVGPADLTGSVGQLPNFGNPVTAAEIEKVIAGANNVGKPWAVWSGDAATAAKWANRGGTLATICEDVDLYQRALRAELQATRDQMK